MKSMLFIVFFILTWKNNLAQNPFATENFYVAFKLICTDGEKGFPEIKGAYRNNENSFYYDYEVRKMLPNADSGIYSIPQVSGIGFPLVTYYFKPVSKLAEAKNKQADLHNAIKTAWRNPLVEVKKIDTVNKLNYYKTYCYKNEEDIKQALILFYSYIIYEKGSYKVVLIINGKTGATAVNTVSGKLLYETNLNEKIKSILAAMDNLFASEKGIVTETNQYYTKYESRSLLYGQKCSLKDRTFEISFTFNAGLPILSGPEEAKTLFEKLLNTLSGTGRFKYNTVNKEGTRTWVFAEENKTDKLKVSKFSLVLEYYDTPYSPSVSMLITRKKL